MVLNIIQHTRTGCLLEKGVNVYNYVVRVYVNMNTIIIIKIKYLGYVDLID